MSQGYDNPSNENNLIRTSTGTLMPSRRYNLSEEIKKRKILEFESYLQKLNQVQDNSTNFPSIELVVELISASTNLYLSYFIGRLNPPHNGHIQALIALINEAKKHQLYIPPLILLGSGPKGLQTLANPIPYELKKEFIMYKLSEFGINPRDYMIMNMTNPASNVRSYISSHLSGDRDISIDKVEIVHVAGDKDDDTGKLAFALNAAKDEARKILVNIPVDTRVNSIPAITTTDQESEMSATQVRKDAYKTLLVPKTFTKEDWLNKYKNFYREFSLRIYDAILEPATGLSQEQIRDYIENSKLPIIASKKSKKVGGKKKTIKKRNKKSKQKQNKKRRITKRK